MIKDDVSALKSARLARVRPKIETKLRPRETILADPDAPNAVEG